MRTGTLGRRHDIVGRREEQPVPQIQEAKPNFVEEYVLRPFVLGSIDGIVTSFVIIAGGLAADVTKSSVVTIGFSSLAADAFSMGVSEYLSSRPSTTLYNAFAMGITCFTSFVIFGAVPLIGYSVSPDRPSEVVLSVSLFVLCLTVIGLLRARISQQLFYRSLIEVMLLGGCAAGIAYGVALASSD